MNYLHYDFQLGPDQVVEVVLDKAANVKLLDDSNYYSYLVLFTHLIYFPDAQPRSAA